jgi:hypothetical protein
MKIKSLDRKAEFIGDIDSQNFSIDAEDAAIVLNHLIDLYSDPIGSVVREVTSNCIDAHRERNLKASGSIPLEDEDNVSNWETRNTVEVSYTPQNSILGVGANISFKDWGVGLSRERVKNIYTKLGKSTKRDANDQIGGFGIGCKSPFAYTTTFYIITVYNKNRYCYMLSRNNSVPTMDLVYQEAIDELNSTEVIVPLKREEDKSDFIKAINDQLPFFENVIYKDFDGLKEVNVLEEGDQYVITEYKNTGGSLRALVGNVIYPLNLKLLYNGYNDYSYNYSWTRCGVLIKFDIGELALSPSRENIIYDESMVTLITDRIHSVRQKCLQDYQKETKDIKDIFKFLHVLSFHNRNVNEICDTTLIKGYFCEKTKTDSSMMYLDQIKIDYSTFEKVFSQISIVSKRKRSQRHRGHSGGYGHDIYDSARDLGLSWFDGSKKIFFVKGRCNREKDYAIHQECGDWIRIQANEEGLSEVSKLLLSKIKESEYTNIYEDYQVKAQINYDNLVNKEDPSEIRRRESKIFVRELCYDKYNNVVKFSNQEEKISDIEDSEDIIIYGYSEDQDLMNACGFAFINNKDHRNTDSYYETKFKGVKIYKISKSNKKYFEDKIYVRDFIMNESEIANDIIVNYNTCRKINTFISYNEHIKFLKDINPKVFNMYVNCRNFLKDNSQEGVYGSSELIDSLHNFMEGLEIYNQDIIADFEDVYSYCDGLRLLKKIKYFTNSDFDSPELRNEIRVYLKSMDRVTTDFEPILLKKEEEEEVVSDSY